MSFDAVDPLAILALGKQGPADLDLMADLGAVVAAGGGSAGPSPRELAQVNGAGATFLFTLGPDHTGRAIKRVFRPGFFGKVKEFLARSGSACGRQPRTVAIPSAAATSTAPSAASRLRSGTGGRRLRAVSTGTCRRPRHPSTTPLPIRRRS